MSAKLLKDVPPSPQASHVRDNSANDDSRRDNDELRAANIADMSGLRASSSPGSASRRYITPSKVLAGVRDIFVTPAVGSLLTLSLLTLCTWWILWLRELTGYAHPYTILYLIPVAIATAFLGSRGGFASSIAVLVLTRIYLFNDQKHGWALLSSTNLAEGLEFATLAVGMLVIAAVTGRLRTTLGFLHASHTRLEEINYRLAATNQRLIESEEQRRTFSSEVLLAVTGGKLNLVERDSILPRELFDTPPSITQALQIPLDASRLRQSLYEVTQDLHMDVERTADLLTSVTEAATNAIKHGGGGTARAWWDTSSVSILVEDKGTGIAPAHLARATLEKGYSTRVSLGMGFHLMLEATDSLTLSTSEQGTLILLQISNKPRISEAEVLLAKYLSV